MGVAGSVFITAAVCASYTIGGGLYSVVYADVVQGLTGILGLVVAAAWMLQTRKHDVPTPSIGEYNNTYLIQTN
jgi:Na+/proline symporter